jgi:hypothetical protein
MIIGISGFARSGKDTVGDILSALGYQRLAFANELRKCMLALDPIISFDLKTNSYIRYSDALSLYGYELAKEIFPEFRSSIQKMATEVGRDFFGEDIWITKLIEKIDMQVSKNWIITDCRFENEINAIRSLGGQLWKIERPGIGAVNSHISEHSIGNCQFDVVINNDSTIEDLKLKVISIVNDYR